MKPTYLVMLAMVLGATSELSIGAPNCTDWMLQPNGRYFRTCVGDDGKQYCEQTVDKKTISRVSC